MTRSKSVFTDEALLTAFRAVPNLSKASVQLFINKLEQMKVITASSSLIDLIKSPDVSWKKLTSASGISQTPSNHHVFLSAVCALFKHVPSLTTKFPKAAREWSQMRWNNSQPLKDRYLDNQPTDRQRNAKIPYAEIESKRDALPAGDPTKLLLMMYTLLPPARGGDYHSVSVHRQASAKPDAKGNYLLLPPSGVCKLVLTEFKTAKIYGTIVHELPRLLCEEIRLSLKLIPRKHLFMSSETGKPFTRSAFSGWANRLLKRLFGKPVTLTMIRHLYVSALDFNKMTMREMEAIGKRMGHRMEMQKQYQWIDQESDGEDVEVQTEMKSGKDRFVCACKKA